MLILQSSFPYPNGLTFSPDGTALLAVAGDTVQVWPRWLGAPPLPARAVVGSLERYAFSPDGARVYLYVSGNSHTRVLDLATDTESETRLPDGSPSWFHFTADGGFFLVCEGEGNLIRYNYAPKLKSLVRKAWAIERPCKFGKKRTAHGSHYRFGAISGPGGVFVALEYRFGGSEPLDGLTVRSVADGALVRRIRLSKAEGDELLNDAGLTLSVHPSGAYFAYPWKQQVRLRQLAGRAKVPDALPLKAECRAVAFHPSGAYLAAVAGPAVTLYDTATWRVMRTLAWEVGDLRAVCFTPDGTRGAAIGTGERARRGKKAVGGKVVVWDMDV